MKTEKGSTALAEECGNLEENLLNKHTPFSNPSEIENRDFTGQVSRNPPLFLEGNFDELFRKNQTDLSFRTFTGI